MSQFRLYFQDKKLHPISREIMREKFEEMAEKGGWWNFSTTQANYTPTRYKYLFDCVYKNALPNVAHKFQVIGKDGKQRPLEKPEELHEYMKWAFNSILILNPETGEVCRVPDTSTKLDDNKFYSVFEEKVIQLLTEMDAFGADGCMSRDKWAQMKHPKKDLQNQ
jgi:hypothetical protein